VVPDLALPPRKGELTAPAPAAQTIAGMPDPVSFERGRTELSSTPHGSPGRSSDPSSVPDLDLKIPPQAGLTSRARTDDKARPHPVAPAAAPPIALAPPPAAPATKDPTPPMAAPAPLPLDGVMIAMGSAQAPAIRRATAIASSGARDRGATATSAPAQDMSLLIGLAVVGLTAIGATAVLMTFVHQPEGLPLVSYVTKPSATSNLVVNGGLAVAGLVLAGRSARHAFRVWRGDVLGGRSTAIIHSVIGGALLFAAIELARAAW
jgi:hypothetical protein